MNHIVTVCLRNATNTINGINLTNSLTELVLLDKMPFCVLWTFLYLCFLDKLLSSKEVQTFMFIIYCFSYYLLTLFASTPFKMIQVSVPVSDFPAMSLLMQHTQGFLSTSSVHILYYPLIYLFIFSQSRRCSLKYCWQSETVNFLEILVL